MRILGIDPGTATTGFGVIEQHSKDSFTILEYGVISTPKTDSQAVRLETIYTDLGSIIQKYQPEMAGVEKLFFATNQKTAMTVSEARGVVLLAIKQNSIPLLEFTPLQIKNIICGYGKAEKQQVQSMVQKTFKLKSLPKPDDAADALAVALCAVWKNNKLKP